MVARTATDKLLEEFNAFFKGSAEVKIKDGRLEITIGTRTMLISLPEAIGGQSTGL